MASKIDDLLDDSDLVAERASKTAKQTPPDFFSSFLGGIGELGLGVFEAVKGATPVFVEGVLNKSKKNPDKAVTFTEVVVPVQGGTTTNPAVTNQGSIVLDIKTMTLIGVGLLGGFILLKN